MHLQIVAKATHQNSIKSSKGSLHSLIFILLIKEFVLPIAKTSKGSIKSICFELLDKSILREELLSQNFD